MKKICVSTSVGGLEDKVYPLFGRAPSFTFVSTEGEQITGVETISNDSSGASGGAGVQSAQLAVGKKVAAVISGRFGPHAHSALSSAGIDMVAVPDMAVKDAVIGYIRGTLKPLDIKDPNKSK